MRRCFRVRQSIPVKNWILFILFCLFIRAQREKLEKGEMKSPRAGRWRVLLYLNIQMSYLVLRILRLRDETGQSMFLDQVEKNPSTYTSRTDAGDL